FTFTVNPSAVCGTNLTATLHLQDGASDLGNVTYVMRVGSLGTASTAQYSTGNINVTIPDVSSVEVPIMVAPTGVVGDVNVKLRLNHTFDRDLLIELVAPDNTTVTLSANHGSNGQNYGTGTNDCGCTPTVFDDSGTTPIGSGVAPFAGTFIPDSPLSTL